MIFLFNETATPAWKLHQKNDSFLRIENTSFSKVGIDILKKMFNDDSFDSDRFNDVDMTRDFVDVTEKSGAHIALRFDKKTMKPFIIGSNKDFDANIMFLSLDLSDGKKVLNYSSRYAYIYDYVHDPKNNRFDMIFSLNNRDGNKASISVVFTDETGEHIISKNVYYNSTDNKFVVITRSIKKTNIPPKGQRGYINTEDRTDKNGRLRIFRYRPAIPTGLLVCVDPSKLDECKDIINNEHARDARDVTFVAEEDSGTLRNTLKTLNEKNRYQAVTYYIDNISTSEILDDRAATLDYLKEKYFSSFFNIVYAMGNDGRIARLQY